MTPHQGAGGGQAIEDAHVLAHLLSHPAISLKTIPLVLRVYDEVRQKIAREVSRRSRLTGMMYELNAAYDDQVQYEGERLKRLVGSIIDIHEWEWTEHLPSSGVLITGDEQVALALRLFEDMIN